MKKLLGKIIYNLSRLVEVVLQILIDVLDIFREVIKKLGRTIFQAIGAFFFIFLFFSGFLGIVFLPTILIMIFIFVLIPIFIGKILDVLKLIKYTLTEYLYDRSEYIIDNKNVSYKKISDYAKEYRRIEYERYIRKEEEKMREQARRAREARRAQEEFFRQFTSGGWYSTSDGSSYSHPMGSSFKTEYEEACKILGVSPTSSEDDIKKAYRAMAKKYHPDLNRSEGATEKFQEINKANEFLNSENIKRYKDLT